MPMLDAVSPDTPLDPAGIDLYRSEVYVSGNPHRIWRRLRAEAPVCRLSTPDGTGFWSVARHRDVTRVLCDTKTFTSEHATMLTGLAGDPAKGRAINLLDGAPHARLRMPALRTMSTAIMREREPIVRERLRRLVASWIRQGEIDLAAALTVIPMIIAGDLLGIPPDRWSAASRWTMASIAPDDPAFAAGSVADTLARAHIELLTLFGELLDARRVRPGRDLISALVTLGTDGSGALTDPDIIVNCYAFVMGASITTPQVVSQLVMVLAHDPDLWRTLRCDPSLRGPALEESLRWSSPINHLLRLATAPARIGDAEICPGDLVCAWTGSANRDESVFAEPFAFDPHRSPNPHLAYGAGPHRCVGVHLARSGLRLLLDELADRVDRFRQTGPARHLASSFVNGITCLPIDLRAA